MLPFLLLVRANAAWTPHPRFFPDDAVYARMCFPTGFLVYWNDFGFYRLLAVPAYALSNRLLMRASLSPVPYTLIALAFATVVFACSCVSAGLSRRRGVLLAGVLLSSPLLLETLNFWSGTFNYALVLLLVSAQLRTCMWARDAAREASEASTVELSKASVIEPSKASVVERPEGVAGGASKKGLIVTAGGALLALLTYEIALPFILATSAFYVRGWLRRVLYVGVAAAVVVAFVLALAAAGLYWPQRFKLAAEQLTRAFSGRAATASNANNSPNAPATANENTTGSTGVGAGVGQSPAPAASPVASPAPTHVPAPAASSASVAPPAPAASPAASHAPAPAVSPVESPTPAPAASLVDAPVASPAGAPERASMYASLLFSFIRTGLGSPWFWALALALAGAVFLSRVQTGLAAPEGRLPWSVTAFAFALALVACAGYLVLTKSVNARYVAFLLIYGAATLAWTRGRFAGYALASLLLLQAAVAASLPVHMRDVELVAKGGASASIVSSGSASGRASDLVSVDGRLARASWGKRFHAPPPVDMLTEPLSPRACRYAAPCEECK